MKTPLPIILFILCIVTLLYGMRKEKRFVVSSYSDKKESDVRLLGFKRNGEPRLISEASVWNNPSFFAVSGKKTLYLINEVSSFGGREGGGITTINLQKDELRQVIGSSVNQGGGGPCYVTLSEDKGYLLTANYGSGSVSVMKINNQGVPEIITDTIFFEHPDSLVSHPHMILFNRSKKVYYITDLGLDRIYIFSFDFSKGKLIPSATPFISTEKGSGPRHMVMDKKQKTLYVVNELNSTVSVYDAGGEVPVLVQTISALPEGYSDKSYSGDICMAPSGRYLYVTNRGNNTIAIFQVKNKRLVSAGHVSCGGNWPRNMALSRNGKRMIICNQRSGDLAFFRVRRLRGTLEKENYSYKLNAPSCVRFIE